MLNQWLVLPTAEHELRHALNCANTPGEPEGPIAEGDPMVVVDGVARIPIVGFLANSRNRWLDYFKIPQTSYLELQAQVQEAEASKKVRAIEFFVDSPGGQASNALIQAADVIHATTKPTTAVVGEVAASAAYWLASQADEIVLSGPASAVGSIGVVVERYVDPGAVAITSTNAPEKRPDPATEQGRADIRKVLDDLHEMFVAAVSRGRGVGAETVNKDFGRGGIFFADKAIEAGMADRVFHSGPEPAAHASIAPMDLETLRSQHPETLAAAVAEGEAKERSRVNAHLTMAESTKSYELACGYIKSGRSIREDEVHASYLAAMSRVSHTQAVVAENAPEVSNTSEPDDDAALLAELNADRIDAGLETI